MELGAGPGAGEGEGEGEGAGAGRLLLVVGCSRESYGASMVGRGAAGWNASKPSLS